MKRRVKRRKPHRKKPANDRQLRMQRILGTFLMLAIVMILLFIGYKLLRPSNSGWILPDRAAVHKNPARAAQTAPQTTGQAKYSFYDALKKRHDEVDAEVREKLAQKKKSPIKGRNYCIQIGAFEDSNSAERVRARMILRDYPVQILRDGEIHLVQIGPYKDRDQALKVRKKLTQEGLKTIFKTYLN